MRTDLSYSSLSIGARPPSTLILHRRSCTRVFALTADQITMGLTPPRDRAPIAPPASSKPPHHRRAGAIPRLARPPPPTLRFHAPASAEIQDAERWAVPAIPR